MHLDALVSNAIERLASPGATWAVVTGPGAAFVASAQRLGWVVHDARRVTVDDGSTAVLDLDSPAIVRQWTCERLRTNPTQRMFNGCTFVHFTS